MPKFNYGQKVWHCASISSIGEYVYLEQTFKNTLDSRVKIRKPDAPDTNYCTCKEDDLYATELDALYAKTTCLKRRIDILNDNIAQQKTDRVRYCELLGETTAAIAEVTNENRG